MRPVRMAWILGVLLGGAGPVPGAPLEPPKDLTRALADLGAREGKVRQAAQAWLADHLEPRDLDLFFQALEGKRDPEVRARAVEALSERLDLFPYLARRFLVRPGSFLRKVLVEQVRRGLPPLPEDPESFQPLPAGAVRLGVRPRTPAGLWGILARNLAFPLPLLAWPGLPEDAWSPPFSWGGPARKLLLSTGDAPWLQRCRVRLRKDCLLWIPPGPPPEGDLAALTVALLEFLGRDGKEARQAALSLGQAPFLPLGAFFLREARERRGVEARPFLWGLGSFAVRSGFGPGPGRQVRALLTLSLSRLQGEGLAWAAAALSVLGPGPDGEGGKLWARAWREAPREARWKVLLPLLKTSFPGTAPLLREALAREAPSPREAACLVRALALQGGTLPRERVARAVRRAGPGAGIYGARLLGPLEKKDGPWAVGALLGRDRGVAELAACALGTTPSWGWKALLESLAGVGDPQRAAPLLQGLRLARDRGAPGLGPALVEAWTRAGGEARKPLGVAFGLLLDEGYFLGAGPESGGLPVPAWKVKDRFQALFLEVTSFLEGLAREEGEPLRFLAARALGRLHGLHQDFRVVRYFPWARDERGRKALFLLLQEWVQVYPQGESLLESAFLRGRWAGSFRGKGREGVRILLAGGPSPWAGFDLEVEDPWAWALAFPER